MAEGHAIIQVGVVVIGRNEGERLRRCRRRSTRVAGVVYVDPARATAAWLARSLGHQVVSSTGAAVLRRARAERGSRALRHRPEIAHAQFVDGDCAIDPRGSSRGGTLDADAGLVAVCGRRREMYAERTVWNRIADVEWTSPPAGEARAFGGDVMIRAAAFAASGGYNDGGSAAEDDELSVRLRAAGGRIRRLECPMTLHDVHMTRVSEWWRRAIRCGHGFAQVATCTASRPSATSRASGAARRPKLPAWRPRCCWRGLTRGGRPAARPLPAQVARIALAERERELALGDALAWALSCVASQPANVWGMWKFRRALRAALG
jgi:hypothetical protein